MAESERNISQAAMYYRHSLPVRIMHWLTVITLPVLLMSGLNIFNANPELYWGKASSTPSSAFLEMRSKEDSEGDIVGITRIMGHEFNTTGYLGASKDQDGDLVERGFPSWLTIPANKWLSMARRWHLFFAWILAINTACYVSYTIFSRHLQRDLLPTKEDLHSIVGTIKDHILLRHPVGEAAKRYNVLQKAAYIGVIFFLIPLVILNGLGLSPGIDAIHPGWVDIFGGRQSMRTIHFLVSWALVAFTAVHLFQVIVNGFWNNLRSMITGKYRVTPEKEHE